MGAGAQPPPALPGSAHADAQETPDDWRKFGGRCVGGLAYAGVSGPRPELVLMGAVEGVPRALLVLRLVEVENGYVAEESKWRETGQGHNADVAAGKRIGVRRAIDVVRRS